MSDMIEQLVRVGFTEYEAKAYVALQRCSPATGYQLAKESGVPRSTIYQVLDKLTVRGAVVTQSFDEMVRYAPVPPDLLLDRMRHEFEDTLDGLATGFRQMAAAPPTSGQAWNIVGHDNILAQAREMIGQAQRDVAVGVGDDDQLDELWLWLQRAHARKVALTVISPVPYEAGDLPLVIHSQGQRLRRAVGHGLTLVVDGREALIGEVDRSQSAVWVTNAYAVAWLSWCLKHEMAHVPLPPARPARRKSKPAG